MYFARHTVYLGECAPQLSIEMAKHVGVPTAALAEQRRAAMHLRCSGASFDEIAAVLKIDERRARRIVADGLAECREQLAASAKEVIALELSRLDALMRGTWDAAVEGNLFAVDRILKLMERRAKMLGLDMTDKQADMTPDEIALEAQRAIQNAMATTS